MRSQGSARQRGEGRTPIQRRVSTPLPPLASREKRHVPSKRKAPGRTSNSTQLQAASVPGTFTPMDLEEEDEAAADKEGACSAEAGDGFKEMIKGLLPKLGLRWSGYRIKTVQTGMRQRVDRRIAELKLPDYASYGQLLLNNPKHAEWKELEGLTHITISRFFRDGPVWQFMLSTVLPKLVELARGEESVRVWVMGFSSGEEVYSLNAAWNLGLGHLSGPLPRLDIVASEYDRTAVKRAKAARYDSDMLKVWQQSPSIWPFCADGSSFKEFPEAWQKKVFQDEGRGAVVRPGFRRGISWRCEPWQAALDEEWGTQNGAPFHLILARNGPFIYPSTATQLALLRQVEEYLTPGGYLLLGKNETLPGIQYASKKDSADLPGWRRAKAEEWAGEVLPGLYWPPAASRRQGKGKAKREPLDIDPRVGRPQGMVWEKE